MVRAPCCEKAGLKKGPWAAEEDLILINYIYQHGHDNWRALPKRAGLLRCGKSCRLRWMNYLRPDIKRGDFTREEEETIIRLHQELGNRWSVIAARIPGRTDNEIKNIWNTHLKKRLTKKPQLEQPEIRIRKTKWSKSSDSDQTPDTEYEPNSPPHSSSETSSLAADSGGSDTLATADVTGNMPEIDESFWSEVFSGVDYSGDIISDSAARSGDSLHRFSDSFVSGLSVEGCMDYWCNLFTRQEDLFTGLPDF